MKLNIKKITPKKGKDYAEVLLCGDVHFGNPQCMWEKFVQNIEYCAENNIYLLAMGDMIECVLKESLGDIYKQKHSPQEQVDIMIDAMMPLAKKKLILGWHMGNHELRIMRETSLDVASLMAKALGVPYLGYACWTLLKVGKMNYRIYSTHGAAGSTAPHTKLKAAIDQSQHKEIDLLAYAHVHDILTYSVKREYVDLRNKVVREEKKFVVTTGHYLSYDGSYAEIKGYSKTKTGSPKVKFFANKKDIHISV
jgi:hypothetical protein